MRRSLWLLIVLFLASSVRPVHAQEEEEFFPTEGLPTIFSIKTSAGWGIGRSRQLYGLNGNADVWWSTGEGSKLNIALGLPLLPIEVVNPDSLDFGLSSTPVVGLELEVATGYHLSTGGTTNDALSNNVFVTTERKTAYVPVTLGFNARSSFGAGMPSVYIGAGGGIWLVAIYEERVSNSNSGSTFMRKMDPPLPFGLYGALGFEVPLTYYPEDGNSMFDLFAELRLTEMSNYVYEYQVTEEGASRSVNVHTDASMLYLRQAQRSASSVAVSLGFKMNIY